MSEVVPLSRLEDCRRVRVILRGLEPPPTARPLVLLVVESDPCDALLLEQALCQAGLEVPMHFVADGQEAIEYLRGDPPFSNRAACPLPTLLLLDLELPRASGWDVLRWLRSQPELSQTQVVVFSACSQLADISRAYAMGADAYLLKPSDRGELINVAAYLKNYWLEMGLLLDHPLGT